MVSIPACHAGDPGSIPGFGEFFLCVLCACVLCATVRGQQKRTDPRGNRTPNLRVWNPTRCHCAMESAVNEVVEIKKQVPGGTRTRNLCLRRAAPYPLGHRDPNTTKSAYSSVGRAGDCRWLQLISLGPWFESGWADFFKKYL